MVTDYTTLFSWDTKTGENIVFPLREIAQHFTFFLPWAGMEKPSTWPRGMRTLRLLSKWASSSTSCLKPTRIITKDETQRHGLNVFFTRLLFCLFAEDTGIFADNQFTNAVGSHTQEDGSDIHIFPQRLPSKLWTRRAPEDKPAYLADFPM